MTYSIDFQIFPFWKKICLKINRVCHGKITFVAEIDSYGIITSDLTSISPCERRVVDRKLINTISIASYKCAKYLSTIERER